MNSFLLAAIIFLSLVIFLKWKMPVWIGRLGEFFVARKLNRLDQTKYKTLNDLMLSSAGNTSATQIDHLVISNFGLFCLETKSYEGWIFGSAEQNYWTQVIFRFKNKFYNPIHQNFAHLKALEALLGTKLKAPIISLVVFPNADKLKISGTDAVGSAREIVKKIENYTNVIYTDAEREGIFALLMSANIVDKKMRRLHNKEVKKMKQV